MTDGTPSDGDVRRALELLQAVRVLQRWLLDQPLGADTLLLTTTTLTLRAGEDQVISLPIPIP
jgi:hypothetical protein